MPPIRVLVVDDSITVRGRIVEALSGSEEFTVIGEAAEGARALELCEALQPDVLTLDMVMPGVDGLEVVEHVMAHHPLPILIVSASVNRGEAFRTFDALSLGALDVLEKPGGSDPIEGWDEELRRRVRMAARIRVVRHPRGRLRSRGEKPAAPPAPPPARPPEPSPAAARNPLVLSRDVQLLVAGASTGGPSAVATLLRGLPPTFPLPILLVVHVGDAFGVRLAEWLHSVSPVPVSLAEDRSPLPPRGSPGVLLAPPGRHLVVEGTSRGVRLLLDDGPLLHGCRPAADALFLSAARTFGASAAGCLLTGMGKDGAAGLLALRESGAPTFGQDEASSIVWGMPGEAARIGAVQVQGSPEELARAFAALWR